MEILEKIQRKLPNQLLIQLTRIINYEAFGLLINLTPSYGTLPGIGSFGANLVRIDPTSGSVMLSAVMSFGGLRLYDLVPGAYVIMPLLTYSLLQEGGGIFIHMIK